MKGIEVAIRSDRETFARMLIIQGERVSYNKHIEITNKNRRREIMFQSYPIHMMVVNIKKNNRISSGQFIKTYHHISLKTFFR